MIWRSLHFWFPSSTAPNATKLHTNKLRERAALEVVLEVKRSKVKVTARDKRMMPGSVIVLHFLTDFQPI